MKRAFFSPPDPFSLSPSLFLLPVKGRIGALNRFKSSLYARYEKVQALQKELTSEADKSYFKRFSAEEAMLKQVLDWLSQHGGVSE